jgi:hypothetical protein
MYANSGCLNVDNKGDEDKIYVHKLKLAAISIFLEFILNFLMKMHYS